MTDSAPADVPTHPSRPAGLIATATVAILAVFAGLSVSRWISADDQPRMQAVVMASQRELVAKKDVIVQEVLVTDGQSVNTGDTLVVVRTIGDEDVQSIQGRLTAAKQQLAVAVAKQDLETKLRLDQIDAEIHELSVQAADCLKQHFSHQVQREAWLDFAKNRDASQLSPNSGVLAAALLEPSPSSGAIQVRAMLEQESARNSAEVFDAKAKLCEARIAKLKTLKSELPLQIQKTHGIDGLNRQIPSLETQIASLESSRINAMRVTGEGIVTGIRCRAGERVQAGETLLVVADSAIRYLDLSVPSEQLDGISVGRRFEISFPGEQIRHGVLRGQLATRPAENGHVTFRIDPVGMLWPHVPIGARVSVSPAE